MPITSIFDLIPNCSNPAPVNVVPFYDGCNWTLVQIPAGVTCNDVLACFTNNPDFIGTLLTSSNGSIVISGHNIEVSTAWMNANIIATLTGPTGTDLTIGTTVIDLSTIFSNINYTFADAGGILMDVGNGDTINLLGIDGMRFFITPANTISVGLPANRQHMQVLTWDDVNHVAYRENNQCCAQTLSFDTATNLLSISGTNSVDLTSINTDSQTLFLNGNILGITQLVNGIYINGPTVDLINVDKHTLGVSGTRNTDVVVCIYSEANSAHLPGTENNCITLPKPDVSTCADVMNCPGIVGMLNDQVSLLNRLISLENQVQILQSQLP